MAFHASITGALLSAPLQPTFMLANRAAIEAEIERLIELLDAADAPLADLELEEDFCLAGDHGGGLAFSAAGGQAWGSREEEPGTVMPRYGVDQSLGPINVREEARAHRAREMGLERSATGGWRHAAGNRA